MSNDKTLFIIKPTFSKYKDLIKNEFIEAGLIIEKECKFRYTKDFLMSFYSHHKDQPWFETNLIPNFSMNLDENDNYGIVLIISNANSDVSVYSKVRGLLGATDPQKADKGTLRERFGLNITMNLAHSSANQDDYNNEIAILNQFYPNLQL